MYVSRSFEEILNASLVVPVELAVSVNDCKFFSGGRMGRLVLKWGEDGLACFEVGGGWVGLF